MHGHDHTMHVCHNQWHIMLQGHIIIRLCHAMPVQQGSELREGSSKFSIHNLDLLKMLAMTSHEAKQN